MLLIDGVRYHLWPPEKEEELEAIVKEHFSEIFGQDAIFFDKSKLQTHFKEATIPDGYIIHLGKEPGWSILEVELSKHPLHEHITLQLIKFIDAIKDLQNRQKLIREFNATIRNNTMLKEEFKAKLGDREIFEFLTQVISQPPTLMIAIEEKTPELQSAVSQLKLETKIVELKTFAREGVGLAVHAHLFEPLFQPMRKKIILIEGTKEEIPVTPKGEGRVTIQDLIGATIIEPGQTIYGWHKGKKYEARIMPDGKIRLLPDGSEFNSLSLAASKGIVSHEVNGWNWWHITDKDGRDCKLDELRKELDEIMKEYKSNLPN